MKDQSTRRPFNGSGFSRAVPIADGELTYVQRQLMDFAIGQGTVTASPIPQPIIAPGEVFHMQGKAGRKETREEQRNFANGAGSNVLRVKGYYETLPNSND